MSGANCPRGELSGYHLPEFRVCVLARVSELHENHEFRTFKTPTRISLNELATSDFLTVNWEYIFILCQISVRDITMRARFLEDTRREGSARNKRLI